MFRYFARYLATLKRDSLNAHGKPTMDNNRIDKRLDNE